MCFIDVSVDGMNIIHAALCMCVRLCVCVSKHVHWVNAKNDKRSFISKKMANE